MKTLLGYLLTMALCGGITALPAFILSIKKRGPARLRLLLAAIPTALLLVPLPALFHRSEYRAAPVLTAGGNLSVTPPAYAGKALPAIPAVQQGLGTILTAEFFVWLWAAGVFIVLLCQLAGGLSVRKFAQSRLPAPKEASELLKKLCAEMRLRPPQLACSALTDTPLLTGLFRPVILLPAEVFDEEELELVLRHELTHLKHGHLWLQAAARLAAALHWFHPAGWWLLRQLPRLCEESCDEIVAGGLPPAERKQYGLVILRFAGASAHTRCTALTSPRQNMERRLQTVIDPIKFSKKYQVLAAAAAALLLCGSCALSYKIAPTELKDGPDEPTVSDLSSPADTSEDPKEPESSTAADEGESSLPDESGSSEAPAELSSSNAPDESSKITEARHPDDPDYSAPASDSADKPSEPNIAEVLVMDENGQPAVPENKAIVYYYQSGAPISAPYGKNGHKGVDLKEEAGSEVCAYADGTVILSEYAGSCGNTVKIDHGDGLITTYAHCDQLLAEVGDSVSAGEAIATVGSSGASTGPHLHFEAEKDGQLIDPTPLYCKTA